MFLAVIETTAIEDSKLMLTVQILSKIIAPLYFMACTRYDAKHNAIFEIAGVWGPHENWHVLILIVHLLQLKALIDQNSLRRRNARTCTVFITRARARKRARGIIPVELFVNIRYLFL